MSSVGGNRQLLVSNNWGAHVSCVLLFGVTTTLVQFAVGPATYGASTSSVSLLDDEDVNTYSLLRPHCCVREFLWPNRTQNSTSIIHRIAESCSGKCEHTEFGENGRPY
uniref:Uncharacterized protein n=1 Tax=Anopheles maculatus TaxID=74869 RepID=A0A182SC91_9DIPT